VVNVCPDGPDDDPMTTRALTTKDTKDTKSLFFEVIAFVSFVPLVVNAIV
jgi:hypothetical protein